MTSVLEGRHERLSSPEASQRFRRRASASGHRLFEAFRALEQLPALDHSRRRLLDLLHDDDAPLADVVGTIESDAALTTATLRAAAADAGDAGAPPTVPLAVSSLSRRALRAVIGVVPTYDFFDRSTFLAVQAGGLRVHALATQGAVRRIRDELDMPPSSFLAVAALLHDIGKVVLGHAYDHYGDLLGLSGSPDERLRLERQALGIDHTVVGGVLIRRLQLPDELAGTVERHHDPQASGAAAVIRLADMVAHYVAGQPLEPRELSRAAGVVGLGQDGLRNVLTSPTSGSFDQPVSAEPCPLSERQLEIIRMLRAGKVYKEIASELEVADSTIRTHLHLAYEKLGVGDRAQAVLMCTSRGWI
jgi:putative nucleotidyltransferase with HDIG domain